MIDALTTCKKTRKIASDALYKSLKKLLKSANPISEIDLRDEWLLELRKHKEIFRNGWYTPPPYGIGVLFATDTEVERLRFKSLRFEEYWPRSDIFLNKESGFAMFYCSPVDRKNGIIGDFGISIYFGKNASIRENIKKELDVIFSIFHKTHIGMKLSDVNKIARMELEQKGFSNEWWISNTDPTGTNYGHTIPGLIPKWSKEEIKIFHKENFNRVIKLLNTRRKFVNASEETVIEPGLAFTIEPRALLRDNPTIPTVYFHTIALFKENGEKKLLTNFTRIFKLVGMDYMA